MGWPFFVLLGLRLNFTLLVCYDEKVKPFSRWGSYAQNNSFCR